VSVQIGDRVEVVVHLAAMGKRTDRRDVRTTRQRMRGRVMWTGPRFATVELDAGYRETFGYEELRVVRRAI